MNSCSCSEQSRTPGHSCLSKRRALSTHSIQPKMDTRFFSKHIRSRQCEFYTDFKQLCFIQIDQLIRSLSLVIGIWQLFQMKSFQARWRNLSTYLSSHNVVQTKKALSNTKLIWNRRFESLKRFNLSYLDQANDNVGGISNCLCDFILTKFTSQNMSTVSIEVFIFYVSAHVRAT